MAIPDVSARLRFLNESAYLLSTTAPEVSRHLMSKHNSLLLEQNGTLTEQQKRTSCGACGTIIIMGWEGKMEIESTKAPRRKVTKEAAKTLQQKPKAMVYTCNSCDNITRFPIDSTMKPPRYKGIPKQGPISGIAEPAPVPEVASSSVTLNSAIKKRTRAKKQTGLGAILAKQKAAQPSGNGFGLDLMDFMKKS
jgi:ribonuclease MRP protein subunit SNM1